MQQDVRQDKSKDTQWLELVQQQVASLRYGVVQIVAHDAGVMQIEITEKLRLEQAGWEGRPLELVVLADEIRVANWDEVLL
jgi:hypothetical protein